METIAALMITEPKITEEDHDVYKKVRYDYDDSHIIYKGLDLGSLGELYDQGKKTQKLANECLVCKELLNNRPFEIGGYGTDLQIYEDKASGFIIKARTYNSQSYAYTICNYCPHCGRKLNNK